MTAQSLTTLANVDGQVHISRGNRKVIAITISGGFYATLWVNTRHGMDDATCTATRWEGKTLKGLQKWADKVLG